MKRSTRLLSSITILTSIVACADDGKTSRANSASSSAGTTQSAESDNESEVDYTTLDDTFEISSATLGTLKKGNKTLETFISRLQKDLDQAVADCQTASDRRNKLLSGLQPIAGELSSLQQKSSSLGDLILTKTKEHTNKVSELANIKGDLAALKTQIASFNGDFKKKLNAAIAKLDNEIASKSKELTAVEKDIKTVLSALPFDSAKYAALDQKRDSINDASDQLIREKVQLNSALSTAAQADLKALEDKAASTQKMLNEKEPVLNKEIKALKDEILQLVNAKKEVDKEITNDKDAQAIKVPELPAACNKLLAR